MKFELEINRIKACLQNNELPGLQKQLEMAPVSRIAELSKIQQSTDGFAKTKSKPRESAVLILLYPKNDCVNLVLMVRATDDSIHSGQVSFPGGKVEESDISLSATALRETHEEIGVIPESVKIIGKLSSIYIPPSNFNVYPIIGVANNTPSFTPNNEVHRLLETNLEILTSPNIRGYEKIYHRTGIEFVVPCFHIHNEVVWGATAMILNEFLDIISD